MKATVENISGGTELAKDESREIRFRIEDGNEFDLDGGEKNIKVSVILAG